MSKTNSRELFTEYVYGSGLGKQSNNCYAFAIDWYGKNKKKLQPGELSKTLQPGDDLTDPKTIKERVIADLKTKKNGGYLLTSKTKCKSDYYKIMCFVDKGRDYHWYRQISDAILDTEGKNANTISKKMGISMNRINIPTNSDKMLVTNSNLWAHKRGLAELTVKDASGNYIKNPRKADRNYGSLNYKTYVATFCIHKDFGKGEDISCK